MRLVLIILIVSFSPIGWGCDPTLPLFEGFGVFLGSTGHLTNATKGTIEDVVEQVYTDLGIRYFRTSYESHFSPSPDVYSISCDNTTLVLCTWMELLRTASKYKDISVFASIWSPPTYMKNPLLDTLKESEERSYYYFIKNVTAIIKDTFQGLQIERVSIVNEPENVFAPWEHTNMGPNQLCRIVKEMNDSLVTLCPENSYFWMTELYANYSDPLTGVSCPDSCEIYATHAYALNIDYWSPFRFYAYYDPGRYSRFTRKPMWMTEVSSTFPRKPTIQNQLREALDFATNIVNFVGTTCVQRYYFWSIYTEGDSGESLIWGDFIPPGIEPDTQQETLARDKVTTSPVYFYPKTYFAYKHFTRAAFGGGKQIEDCTIINPALRRRRNGDDNKVHRGDNQVCLKFTTPETRNSSTVIFVNKANDAYRLTGIFCTSPICCTTEEFDWHCVDQYPDPTEKHWMMEPGDVDENKIETGGDKGGNFVYNNGTVIVPKKSVCSCQSESGKSEIILSRELFSNEI